MREALTTFAALATALTAGPALCAVRASFLYALSDPAVRLDFGSSDLSWDRTASELYVTAPRAVVVFSDSGMMVHSFTGDSSAGAPISIAPLEDGTMVILTVADQRTALWRCNFRGDPVSRIELPGDVADFGGNRIGVAGGKIYLANLSTIQVLVIGLDGRKQAFFDFGTQLGFDGAKRADNDMRGFSVDGAGNMYFTIPTQFSAFVASPEGRLRSFGTRGSSPGKFSVVAGIAADDDGHLYVTDILRAVVMVFDKDFRFLGEFGYRGSGPENLVGPSAVAVGNGRVYVSQSTGSVKVFGVQFE